MKCPRCGHETNGVREGDSDYCTTCGGVLGPAYTPDGRRACKPDCVWVDSPKHKANPDEPCETEAEVSKRRADLMGVSVAEYERRLADWLS